MVTKRRKSPRMSSHQEIAGSSMHMAFSAKRVGDADASERLVLTLRLRRKRDHPKLPDQHHWSRTPPGERTFLSREEFAKQYGADPEDMKAIRKFAKLKGLKVVDSSIARRTVLISGTVKQFSRIFQVSLGVYSMPGGVYRSHEGSIHLPTAIAPLVQGVFGLDDRRIFERHSSPGSPTGAAPLTVPQVEQIYGFDSVTGRGNGQTIGIIEYGGGYIRHREPRGRKPSLPDIDAYFSGIGLTTPDITDVLIDGAKNSQSIIDRDSVEVALDIDVAGSIAQDAHLVVYFAPNSIQGSIDSISTAVHDVVNKPTIISISWGGAESDATGALALNQSTLDAISESFAEAAAMGISIFASSGDDGANCNMNDGSDHVFYPASDPWITGCGGTIIKNVAGNRFSELTWNDKAWVAIPYLWYPGFFIGGATGGGFSRLFAQPKWQVSSAPQKKPLRHRLRRGVPDIAGNASQFSGYTIQIFGQSLTVGGTSAVAPLYAGLFAKLNAMLGYNLGFLNPILYASRDSSIFRDINDSVSNCVPYVDNSNPIAFKTSPGYESSLGWDAVTGLGVIDCAALLKALLGG